jgi:hypothetical protein
MSRFTDEVEELIENYVNGHEDSDDDDDEGGCDSDYCECTCHRYGERCEDCEGDSRGSSSTKLEFSEVQEKIEEFIEISQNFGANGKKEVALQILAKISIPFFTQSGNENSSFVRIFDQSDYYIVIFNLLMLVIYSIV